MPAGGYLLNSPPTTEVNGEAGAGLELPEPGVVTRTAWRPDPRRTGIAEGVWEFVAVGSKP